MKAYVNSSRWKPGDRVTVLVDCVDRSNRYTPRLKAADGEWYYLEPHRINAGHYRHVPIHVGELVILEYLSFAGGLNRWVVCTEESSI